MFITFEGIEGSGKTTQIELLYRHLAGQGHDVILTREPGGTPFGEALRNVCLRHNLQVASLSELLVIEAIRAQHVEEVIMPALSAGRIVLCDRFVDATYAYQGYGRGIELGIIETMNRLVTKGIRPNLTVLLDCPATKGLKRKTDAADHTRDRFEREDISFHRKIQKAYLKLARDDSRRFFVVDGRGDVDAIHRTIRERVEGLLESRGL